MKKHLFTFLIIIFSLFSSHAVIPGLALDEGGCLTCHKYPGLVRLEKSSEFKVLHIDEARYFNSPHGKFSCKKCHTTIVKVPHTGESRTDCTTAECHQSEKDRALIDDYPLKTFHRSEQSFITKLEDESSCRVCHHLYPHSENNVVRALLNLHAGFMLCEVCHIKRDKFIHLVYEWNNTENAEFNGEPFGTYYNPQTRETQKGEHFISRIAAFSISKDKKRPLMNTRDTVKATEFISKEKNLKPNEKEKDLAYLHRDIEKKEISVACNECHSSKGILDFKKLGFSDKKTKDLIYLNIKGLVTKYKTFYFPNLFGN